jgi:eukaryotic-like serine/threonine-protein kinase
MLTVDAQRVRQQLNRILASTAFSEAERARRFLRYVVDRKLEGRDGEIKESVIAIEVLGRNASFDSKSDPIVRVEAGRLRDRLGAYYEAAGGADPILISLPKGRYVPEFTQRQPVQSPGAGVLRLSILPPENAIFESFAVSPDGRTLAFTATVNGRIMLWIRALDSLEAKPLAGTDNASWPFWSPDSRSIGFFVPNKLKAVEASGGPAREIADVVVGKGAAWSSAGVILFCPRPMGILCQVPDAGGSPVPVTSLDESRAEIMHGFPQFLPDGRHFLYLAACSRPGASSIRAGSLDSGSSKILVPADTSAAYAPVLSGHLPSLLFVHDGALIAQSFDPQSLELGGDRAVVIREIRYQRWNQAKFSVSSKGVLLYQAGCAENLQLTWLDRQGKFISAVGAPNNYLSIGLSPHDRYVAVHRHDDPDTVLPTIWIIDMLRENALFRITDADTAVPELSGVWARDDSEILFSRGDDRRMRLFRRALNGGAARCVLDTEGPKFPADWSSNGKFIAYTSQFPDFRNLHTWMAAFSGTEEEAESRPFLQHSCNEFSAQFSPADGGEAPRWIAYASNETGRSEIYVRDFPSGGHKWQVSSQGGVQPHWRGDGRELVYLSLDGMLMSVVVDLAGDAQSDTFEFGPPQPLFATGLRFLTRYAVWMNQYSGSRDGQRFLVNRPVLEATQGAITAVIPW